MLIIEKIVNSDLIFSLCNVIQIKFIKCQIDNGEFIEFHPHMRKFPSKMTFSNENGRSQKKYNW